MLIALAAIVVLSIPAVPALGQGATSTTMISIDSPADGTTITNGSQVDIGGWAADSAGPGTGVDMVRVYIDGRMDADGKLLGNANYGGARPDVATTLGSVDMTNSGYDLVWNATGLGGGSHMFYVYAHSIANGWAYKTVGFTAPAQPTPAPARGQMGPGGPGGYGYNGPMGPTTPYGGGYLNNTPYGGYGSYNSGYGGGGGYGGGCVGGYGYYDYFSTGCSGPPPIPPYGGGYGIPPFGGGGGIPYQQTVTVISPPGGTVVLSWIATPNAQSYRIYQAIGASPNNFSVVQTIPQSAGILATNATVAGLAPGQNYFFQVRAVDQTGLETVVPAYTNQAFGGGFPGVPGFPGGPIGGGLPPVTGLVVTGVTGTTITLTWAAVPGAISYRVLQAVGNSGAFVPAVMSNTSTTSAVISGLTLSTPYTFEVIALDAFGNQSPPSIPVPATTGLTRGRGSLARRRWAP